MIFSILFCMTAIEAVTFNIPKPSFRCLGCGCIEQDQPRQDPVFNAIHSSTDLQKAKRKPKPKSTNSTKARNPLGPPLITSELTSSNSRFDKSHKVLLDILLTSLDTPQFNPPPLEVAPQISTPQKSIGGSSTRSSSQFSVRSGVKRVYQTQAKSTIHTQTISYYLDYEIGKGTFGNVYSAHDLVNKSSLFAVKVCHFVSGQKDTDARNDYVISRRLCQKQEQNSSAFKNVVHFVAVMAHTLESNTSTSTTQEYLTVMEKYPLSLRDLIDIKLESDRQIDSRRASVVSANSSMFGFDANMEVYSMGMVLDFFCQIINGFGGELKSIWPKLKYNDWSPANIMLTKLEWPMINGSDIVYKLADFGKAQRDGKCIMGTGQYMSMTENATAEETQDLNSLSVIGIELMSAFCNTDNIAWRYILETTVGKEGMAKSQFRNEQITDILQEMNAEDSEPWFANKEVGHFFKQLLQFTMDETVTFGVFGKFLVESGEEIKDFEYSSPPSLSLPSDIVGIYYQLHPQMQRYHQLQQLQDRLNG